MKKFMLTVSEPCHENWDKMTSDQRGRFCLSCQKTVVDFTGLSDRQIAAFFKKPPESVCGRFYQDQLNRPIEVPRKRIRWIKYFFQFTWPAFVLFLKSCGQRETTVGKPLVKKSAAGELVATIGVVMQITPVDTSSRKFEPSESVKCTEIKGDTIVTIIDNNTTSLPVFEKLATTHLPETSDTSETTLTPTRINSDSVAQRALHGVLGGVSVVEIKKGKEANESPGELKVPGENEAKEVLPVVYPNPVRSGQRLTVKMDEEFRGLYRILSLSGQSITTGRLVLSQKQPFTIPTPSLPSGTYVLQFLKEGETKSTAQKFIVQ
jgi:hypothetical protein